MAFDFAQHRGLHPIVENLTRHAPEMIEGLHVQPQHGLQILVFNETRPQIAAMAEHDREQPDRAPDSRGVVEHDVEVREVHLRLPTRRGLEAHFKAAVAWRPHLANQLTQHAATAWVAHGPDLAQQPLNAERRKLAHTLTDVVDVGVYHAWPRRPRPVARHVHPCLDVFAHCLAIYTQSSGDGRDAQPLPMQF